MTLAILNHHMKKEEGLILQKRPALSLSVVINGGTLTYAKPIY